MKKPDDQKAGDPDASKFRPSRRDFLKISALGAAAIGGSKAMASDFRKLNAEMELAGRGNEFAGKIVILHDPAMNGHIATIDRDVVETKVLDGISALTGIGDTGLAFERLFPGVNATSTFAIKVNCIASCCTRWEVARGAVSGLSQMLGGTYDVSQVIIYDRHNIGSYGYTESEFTFNGNYPTLSSTNNASGSGYYVWDNHQLSQYLLDVDYVIDIPALKSHSDGNNQITVALKNHYGSCSPASLCGDIPGMLTLNGDPNVKNKTGLVITDGLRGTYEGGPSTPPMTWSNYTEGTPNTLLITTDPVTNDYWARDMINAQRDADGYAEKPCPWVETASGDPYTIGVSDPGDMNVIQINPEGTGVESGIPAGAAFLSPNEPNPFHGSTRLRFRLDRPGHATLKIYEVSGRLVRTLGETTYPGGMSELSWDGRDSRGRQVSAGVYLARLQAGNKVQTRRVVKIR